MFLAPVSLSTQLLSTGACRFAFWNETYACLCSFCQNSQPEKKFLVLIYLVSKHPVDVPFKKSSGHVRHNSVHMP